MKGKRGEQNADRAAAARYLGISDDALEKVRELAEAVRSYYEPLTDANSDDEGECLSRLNNAEKALAALLPPKVTK